MFAIFIMLAVLFLLSICFVTYYSFSKEFKHGRINFTVISLISLFIMVGAITAHKSIPTEFLRRTSLFTSAIVFIVLIYSPIFFILRLIITKIAKAIKREDNKFIGFVSNAKRCVPVILAFTILLSAVGFVNMGILRESDFSVDVDKPSYNKSLNCVVVSDTHLGTGLFTSQLDELVEKINNCNPDVVFLVGDIIDENTLISDYESLEKSFKNIVSKYGTYFVYGNHEGYSGSDPAPYLENAGITVLSDEASVIGDITIIGRADGYQDRKELSEIIKENNVDLTKPVIVLNHEPVGLEEMSQQGADVSICGHTHGEQFPLTQNIFSLANDMMYGIEDLSGMTGVTTSGAAGWGIHFKLPAKSEVMKLTLNFN